MKQRGCARNGIYSWPMALCCGAIKIQTDGKSTAFTTDEFMPYIELHAGSAFSFLRGGSFPEQLAETAAELEMPALALLDRDGVYGAQRFSVAAREHNVRPIIGCELTMEDGGILPVLVENRTGYKNLCELLTQAHLRSEKRKSAVKCTGRRVLVEGLVVLFSEPSRAQFLSDTFGRENVFVEIQRHF